MKMGSLVFGAGYVLAATMLLCGGAAVAQQKAVPATQPSAVAPEGLAKRVETYLRDLYAWGPAFQVKVGVIADAPVGGLYQVPVEVTVNGQSDSAVVYVSKDGHYLVRGDIQDLKADPLASIRKQLTLDGYGSAGPANAKVVLVEFADFECPSCRQLNPILHDLASKYPQIRVVFKDYPLEQIHPWAMTAAIASHCALQKSPDAFWKFHDAVYDQQDLITAENAYSKLVDIAIQAGLEAASFRACMASSEARDAVDKSIKEAQKLKINSTPTTYVNGRQVIGPDPDTLDQFTKYDLNQ
jgi:protein-disulfide isomerase